MKKTYALINTAVILAVIYWNYYSNTGKIGGKTIGELSDKYYNLFTPAGYAFAIWGIIFLSLMILGINQIRWAFFGGDENNTIVKIGPWLTIANIGNAAWLWFWLHEQTGVSVLVMLVILVSLIQIVRRLNMENYDASAREIAFVWWPVSLYSGWIAVATIANISAWLTSIQWVALFTEIQWTIIMVSIAALLNLFMIYSRNMREFACVGVWAIAAIGVRHWGNIPLLQWTSVCWSAVLLGAILWHGYNNRKENAFFRMVIK